MSVLRQKAIHGFFWSIIESFSGQGITFLVGIFLARLLLPHDFGLIGMVAIFIAISMTFIDSGFSQALIRKKDCTELDLSTVFHFNLIIGVIIYLILFFLAPFISDFFEEPQLVKIVRVLSLVIIVDSLTVIQRTILIRRIDFKLQTKISIIASLISGLIAIGMALRNWGVWSLVARQLINEFTKSFLLWFWNKWSPSLRFSKDSFKELFNFGSKLLISELIRTIYYNIYYIIIGKYFSARELGYYTTADNFKKLPSQNISKIIQQVTYPVLASIQDDIPRLKANYKKIILSTALISFTVMIGIASVAEQLILTLIGEKWHTSIVYLQLLSFIGMMYPIHSLNLSMLKVQGRSDLFLKISVIKRIFAVPVILLGIFFGIKVMITAMIINTLINYYINSYWSGKNIGYSMKDQIIDILPYFIITFILGVLIYFLGVIIHFAYWIELMVQIVVGSIILFGVFEIFKLEAYINIKEIILSQIKNFKRK